jgi:hypothetical protein
LGYGVVFHITPGNIPVNFAFSYIFGLLAGNSNIVKMPPKIFPQAIIIISAIKKIWTAEKYHKIRESTIFMQYDPDDAITSYFSSICKARVLWGGDETIRIIRKVPVPVRAIEIAFADRYSLCVINARAILELEEKKLKHVCAGFYNDTFFMDQNACSSPHIVIWLGEEDVAAKASDRFWRYLHEETANRYTLAPVSAVDKLTTLCENAIDIVQVSGMKRFENSIYVIKLSSLPDNLDTLRGKCGYFYEYATIRIEDIAPVINNKYQTLTYYGVSQDILKSFIYECRPRGIDRIVPIGSALDISVIWDGYDLIRTMSRVIDLR